MFNLEEAIARWRQQLLAAGIMDAEILDELDSHLQDEVEEGIESGLTEEQAWKAAVASIGDVHALRVEFAKASRPAPGSKQALQAFYFGSILFLLLVNTWTLLECEARPTSKLIGTGIVGMIALYLTCLPHLLRSLPPSSYDRLIMVIKLTSNLVWVLPVWVLLHATHVVSSELGMVPTAVLLCLCAAIGLSGVAYVLYGNRSGNGGAGDPPGLWPCSPQPIPPFRPVPPDFRKSLAGFGRVDAMVEESFRLACSEATRLGHGFIGTEHLLLGLLKLNSGINNVLQSLGLDRENLTLEVERFFSPQPRPPGNAKILLTPRAQRAIVLATREAKTFNRGTVGAEHVLLGLLLEGSGVAAKAMRKVGIDVEKLRKEISGEPTSTGDNH